MTIRTLPLVRRSCATSSCVAVAAALTLVALSRPPRTAAAQVVEIKTLPIAQGDQFAFFPSANQGMAGLSIALADPLLDPFVNPAKGARLGGAYFVGSPTFYSLTRDAGGGKTLPIGGLLSSGSTFGGALFALQELSPNRTDNQVFAPPVLFSERPSFPQPEQLSSKENHYAFGMLGRRFADSRVSIAGSMLWSGLRRIDGVDQLYAGSQSVRQAGSALDARLGLLKEWEGNRSLEAMVLHEHLDMTHDVAFLDRFWDPNTRLFSSRPRLEHNLDRSKMWGLHLAYQQPLADAGWRVGTILTGNLLSHPKLPNYEVEDVVQPIPWDPGHSAAYNLGLGVARTYGATTFGMDAIYEPIRSHTWGEAPAPITTASGGTIPAGGKTTENQFRFSNGIVRTGLTQDLQLEGVENPLRLQLGLSAHVIHYWLDQVDHEQESRRQQEERWTEWTRTWGMSLRISTVEMRYLGRSTSGTGRPGVRRETRGFFATPDVLTASNIVAAPSGPLTLTDVRVTTHQISLSVPIR